MIKNAIKKISRLIGNSISIPANENDETLLLSVGCMLSNQQWSMQSHNINDYEFKIFSQFGDDGIIQYLIKHIEIKNEIFIEFGTENYLESNTRFLMMHNNWSGFIMDGSSDSLNSLKNQSWFWKYDLTYKPAFIDKENINDLLESTGFSNIGLLNIDIDGNDYHILTEIDLSKLNPSIIVVEYNSTFGKDRLITVPYNKNFNRTKKHYSNLFWGASLPAIHLAASEKGYSLIGCNLAGNNAYFVRKDLLNEKVKELSIEKGYKESKFRDSRNENYSLSYIAGKERFAMIEGLEVFNIKTNHQEKL